MCVVLYILHSVNIILGYSKQLGVWICSSGSDTLECKLRLPIRVIRPADVTRKASVVRYVCTRHGIANTLTSPPSPTCQKRRKPVPV